MLADDGSIKDANGHVQGRYTYYYASDDTPVQIIFIFGVGTDMRSSNYMTISKEIVTRCKSVLFIVLDHNPGNLVKLNGNKFASNANMIASNPSKYFPKVKVEEGGGGVSTSILFVIGGHSAGGSAAIDAMNDGHLTFTPVGFLGLDPYSSSDFKGLHIPCPGLFWGFDKTTCFVKINKAAEACYDISPINARALYRVHNDDGNILHCIFADDGCLACPAKMAGYWVRRGVGLSVEAFVKYLFMPAASFSQDAFWTAITDEDRSKLTLYVNTDEVYVMVRKQKVSHVCEDIRRIYAYVRGFLFA